MNPLRTGDTRIVKKLLLFPKIITGKRKWMCFAKWEEMYEIRLDESSHIKTKWIPLRWLDK